MGELGRLLRRLGCVSLAVAALFLVPHAFAEAITVDYSVASLNGSAWQYNYMLAGTFNAGDDVTIVFPYATSSSLMDLATGGPDWTTFVLQPDPQLPADGEFDIVANLANPDLARTFSVTFQDAGTGAPGSQDFTAYSSAFALIATGTTQPAAPLPPVESSVPEPSSLALLSSGLLGVGAAVRRRL